MPVSTETANVLESFYVHTSLDKSEIHCSDERGAGIYIHLFGGALNTPYALAIMEETLEPGSVTQSFEEQTATVVPILIEKAGLKVGVHSDENSEEGRHLRVDRHEGPVGCGFAEKRPQISLLINEMGQQIVARAAELQPELFENEDDFAFADSVSEAHGRLANREGFFTTGRKVVVAAAHKGAKTMMVAGAHTGKLGEINTVSNTSIDSLQAKLGGHPAYGQDVWAPAEIHERIHNEYPYDAKQLQIAQLIDSIGVMRFLGVEFEDISIRRPED